jgi:sulfatase modifying factor 1
MTWVRRGGWASLVAVFWVGCYEVSNSDDVPNDGEAGSSGSNQSGAGANSAGASGSGVGGGASGSGGVAGSAAGSATGGTTSGGTSANAGQGGADEAGAGGRGEGGVPSGGTSSSAGDSSLGGEGNGVSGTSGASGIAGESGEGGASGNASGGDGGDDGGGCTGELEEIVDGLCVAKMATVPSDAGDYLIDRTEVTRGQYASWLATNPSPLPVVITACAFNSSYEPYEPCAHAEGPGSERHPMTCIDWCDARFYCAAVGKRLCGATTGGGMPYDPGTSDWRRDQWGLACNASGVQIFTYGEPYAMSACNSESSATTPVASLETCQSADPAYAGIYDLNGNAREWIDQCRPDNSSPDCYARGGGFDQGAVGCSALGYSMRRTTADPNLGFRCCRL